MAQVVAGAIPVTHPAFLAQLVEHLSCKQEVTGSSPVGGSSLEQIILVVFVLVSIVKVLRLKGRATRSGGCWLDTSTLSRLAW